MKKIFPHINWKKEVRFFRRNRLLQKGSGPLRITSSVKKALLSDSEETMAFHRSWIESLEPLKWHTDTALSLALHYVSLKQYNEAITILTNVAGELEPGWWNDVYLSTFKIMYENGILKHLNSEMKVQFHNAIGLCFSRARKYKEAIKWFLRLRQYSKRISNIWGVGQSFINCGVTYYHSGEITKAERCYRESIEYARRINDNLLLGRSLHNLAMTIIDWDYDQTMQLITESLALKKSRR